MFYGRASFKPGNKVYLIHRVEADDHRVSAKLAELNCSVLPGTRKHALENFRDELVAGMMEIKTLRGEESSAAEDRAGKIVFGNKTEEHYPPRGERNNIKVFDDAVLCWASIPQSEQFAKVRHFARSSASPRTGPERAFETRVCSPT